MALILHLIGIKFPLKWYATWPWLKKKKLHPEEPEALHLPFKKLAQNDSIYSAIKNMNNFPFHSKFAFSFQWASCFLKAAIFPKTLMQTLRRIMMTGTPKHQIRVWYQIEQRPTYLSIEICWPLRDLVPNSYLMFNYSHGMRMALECYTNWVSRKNSNFSIATKTATLSFRY